MYAGPEASFLSVMTPKKFSSFSHLIFSFIFVTYQYAVILVIANIKQRVKVLNELVVCTIVQMYLQFILIYLLFYSWLCMISAQNIILNTIISATKFWL